MSSVKTWRRAALAAYVAAGVTLPLAGYALATTQANVNAVAAAQERLTDEERRDSLADLAPVPVELDTRPYSAAVDWSAVAANVMPSVVMVSTMPAPFGDGSPEPRRPYPWRSNQPGDSLANPSPCLAARLGRVRPGPRVENQRRRFCDW